MWSDDFIPKFKPVVIWLWSLLPDRCDMPGCCRKGIRGNENKIAGRVVCDYCCTKMGIRQNAASGGQQ